MFVDTAPVMEKPLAASAGLGWQGKHTNLVSREFGSWLFIGSIFTTATIAPDEPEADHCGGCSRCLDICPTHAFTAPYQIDARRCISYLTIEHKGHIAPQFREAMGNRIFGCDDCLAVCPWNKFAQSRARDKVCRQGRDRQSASRRASCSRRRRIPRALPRHAYQADRACALPAQRPHCRRKFPRRHPRSSDRGAPRRRLATGARHGGVGARAARTFAPQRLTVELRED